MMIVRSRVLLHVFFFIIGCMLSVGNIAKPLDNIKKTVRSLTTSNSFKKLQSCARIGAEGVVTVYAVCLGFGKISKIYNRLKYDGICINYENNKLLLKRGITVTGLARGIIVTGLAWVTLECGLWFINDIKKL